MSLPRAVVVVTAAVALAGAAAPDAVAAVHAPLAGATGASLPDRLRGVHDAKQLVVVTAPDNHTSYATLRAYRLRHGTWRRVFGPWPARIGDSGFAPRGGKREGDGQTPTGSWHFRFMFGTDADPGVHYRYRRSHSTSYWDDDSTTRRYNRWVDSRRGDPGRSPEPMRVLPNYRYGAVVAYNWDQTPYRGSAIFLHVTDGTGTAGCIAIARHRVVRVLRWLRPSLSPRIVMGRTSAVTR